MECLCLFQSSQQVKCCYNHSYANPTRSQTKSQKRSLLRKANKNQYTHNLRANNDKYIKNLSAKTLTDHETALLAKGLKFIPTPPNSASHNNLLKDFEAFTRSMRLQYIFVILRASLTSSTLNLIGNRRHNHQLPQKAIWNAQSMRLLLLLSLQLEITYQQNKDKH